MQSVTRDQALRYRVHAQQLDRSGSHSDADVLDIGVQDTGYDGAGWALAIRGAAFDPADHFLAWTLRGAPTAYRRSQAAAVARATMPWSEVDAAKRIFDAAKPLKAADIAITDALERVGTEMRDVVRTPTVKGDVSAELNRRLPEPYQRFCRSCDAEHLYEQPFRLGALWGGLELEPDTSPPVLRRMPRWRGPTKRIDPALDPVRAALHLLGPTTPKYVAGYIDTPVREIKARWPDDVVSVDVDGEERSILADDADALADPADVAKTVRLLGNYDLYLQVRDRELLVSDADRRKELWPVLGRPGAILAGHEIAGVWRPRTSGSTLRLEIEKWGSMSKAVRSAVDAEGERLAEFRGLDFGGVVH